MGFFSKLFNFKNSSATAPNIPKCKSVTDPIEGYTLHKHYRNIEISSWDWIPADTPIGNKVIFMQEPTNRADPKAVLLVFVPQRKKFGYLFRGAIQDEVNKAIKRGDKVVGRLSYLVFKPQKTVKIDIAIFKKSLNKEESP